MSSRPELVYCMRCCVVPCVLVCFLVCSWYLRQGIREDPICKHKACVMGSKVEWLQMGSRFLVGSLQGACTATRFMHDDEIQEVMARCS